MNVTYKSDRIFQTICHIVLVIFSFVCLFPFVLMLISSFSSEASITKYGYSIFPRAWSLEAYAYIAREWRQIGQAYITTIVVTLVGTLFGVFMTMTLAYLLSRRDLPGRKFLNIFVFFTMLFNGGLVPTYLMYVNYFHIKNTYMALLIPSLMLNAFYIMITRSYIQSNIPEELVEACRIDGASETKIFWKMVLPLSKPIFVTLVLFIGIGYWNDWLNGMYYLTEPKYFSIQNLLNKMLNNVNFLATNSTVASQAGNVSIPSITIRMAIAMVGILPIIIIYPFLQKYFVKGITLGAVKG